MAGHIVISSIAFALRTSPSGSILRASVRPCSLHLERTSYLIAYLATINTHVSVDFDKCHNGNPLAEPQTSAWAWLQQLTAQGAVARIGKPTSLTLIGRFSLLIT